MIYSKTDEAFKNDRTMIHSKTDEAFSNVPFRQIVEEIRLEKE
jgi:hypothetical protein